MRKHIVTLIAGLTAALLLTSCTQPSPAETASDASAIASENAALKEQLAEQQKSLDELKAQVDALQSSQAASVPEVSEPEKVNSQLETASSTPPTPAPQQTAPEVSTPQPAASQPAQASSNAPKIVQNPDGTRSMTIQVDVDTNSDGKRPSANGGTTREQAEEYLRYLREYAESKGMTWTRDAISGGYEPAMETDGKSDFKASIRTRIDGLLRNEITSIYAELKESSDVENEWDIIIYR